MQSIALSRTEKGAIVLTTFAVGLMATLWVLDKNGVFS